MLHIARPFLLNRSYPASTTSGEGSQRPTRWRRQGTTRDPSAMIAADRQLGASSQLAAQLARLGVAQGQVVSLYSPNCPEWIIGYYAVMKLGAVVNPLNQK